MRNPARTAITSAALMVGVGLVVFVAVFAAGVKASFTDQLDRLVKADVFVFSEAFEPIPADAAGEVEGVPGVRAVASLLFDQIEVNARRSNVMYDSMLGIDPEALRATYAFEWLEGDDSLVTDLGRNEALVEEQFAKAHDLDVGDGYRVVTPSGGRAWMRVEGIYRDPTILQGTVVTPETVRLVSPAKDPYGLFVDIADSADADRVRASLETALRDFPTATVEDRTQYKETIEAQLDQIVFLLYALLAMSVVVSLFGIANSLFLSIHERTREFGLLRAVGATTAQVRRVVRYESVITALIGGLLGTVVGIAFAWAHDARALGVEPGLCSAGRAASADRALGRRGRCGRRHRASAARRPHRRDGRRPLRVVAEDPLCSGTSGGVVQSPHARARRRGRASTARPWATAVWLDHE